MERHDQILRKDPSERPLIFYTDGSGIEGRIGAAAVVDLEDQHAHSQMGHDSTSTVYAVELRVIEMALAKVLEGTEPWAEQAKNGVVIFVDIQAALRALGRPRMPSGQVYLAGCLDLIRRLAGRGIRTELRCTKEVSETRSQINTRKKQPRNRTGDRTLITDVYVSRPQPDAKSAVKQRLSGRRRGPRRPPVDRRDV